MRYVEIRNVGRHHLFAPTNAFSMRSFSAKRHWTGTGSEPANISA